MTSSALLVTLQNFAEIGARNWNFEGHQVTSAFTEDQGRWDYTDTTYEPWLFDRADVWRMMFELTGSARWQTQANSDLAYYQARLSVDGYFLNKAGEQDSKYSYVHPWSTRADNATIAKRVYDATVRDWSGNPTTRTFWTERELWVALSAAVRYHTVSGDSAALVRAQSQVDEWDTVRAGKGAPLVTYERHEGGGPEPTALVTSPWMSALYFQAARQYILKAPAAAPQVYKQASDYFDWLNVPANRGFYPGTDAHPSEFVGLTFPAYLAGGTTSGDAGPDEGHMDHALDMAGFIAFAIKAKQALGLPTTAAQQRLADMKLTAARSFQNWTREAAYLPKYRITPPRKFNWWVRGYYELVANGGA